MLVIVIPYQAVVKKCMNRFDTALYTLKVYYSVVNL